MIDTDKYENHEMIRIAKQLLIEDAPLLLAEVKRLREGIKRIADLAVQRNARHTEKGLLELIE